MGWLWMVPTADDFEPQKDQIRAYEEIGGGGGRGGEGAGEGVCQDWRMLPNSVGIWIETWLK